MAVVPQFWLVLQSMAKRKQETNEEKRRRKALNKEIQRNVQWVSCQGTLLWNGRDQVVDCNLLALCSDNFFLAGWTGSGGCLASHIHLHIFCCPATVKPKHSTFRVALVRAASDLQRALNSLKQSSSISYLLPGCSIMLHSAAGIVLHIA